MRAHIIESENVTYGVIAVPGTDTLAILRRSGDKWYGVGQANFRDGTAALIGEPIPEGQAALDAALDAHMAMA